MTYVHIFKSVPGNIKCKGSEAGIWEIHKTWKMEGLVNWKLQQTWGLDSIPFCF